MSIGLFAREERYFSRRRRGEAYADGGGVFFAGCLPSGKIQPGTFHSITPVSVIAAAMIAIAVEIENQSSRKPASRAPAAEKNMSTMPNALSTRPSFSSGISLRTTGAITMPTGPWKICVANCTAITVPRQTQNMCGATTVGISHISQNSEDETAAIL